MSKTRKILSIVLAVVMAFSVFSICAFADTPAATWSVEVTNLDGTALGATISTGDKVLVTVKLQSNFYVGTVAVPVVFSDIFQFVTGTETQSDIYGAGATYKAFNGSFTTGVPSGSSAVYAVFVPNSGASGAASPMYSTATTILTFQLEAVGEGTADITLPAAMQKTSSNIGGKFYVGARASSDVTTDEENVEQAFALTNAAAQVVISDVVATPELSGVNGGYVDDVNGYVYGIPIGEDVEDYFTVSNGSFTVTGGAVTGATLTVKDAGGNDYATYTVIIFGDVDGSGDITLLDSALAYGATNGVAISDPVAAFAADVDGSGDITLLDKALIYGGTNGVPVTVNPYA